MSNENKYTILKKIINEVDPIGLVDFDTPESLDEYESEIRAILQEDISEFDSQQLAQLVHKVFVRFFNEEVAGTEDKYELIANRYLEANS